MKYLLTFVLVVLSLPSLPLPSEAFSDGFKQYMTQLQTRVMYRGESFTPDEIKRAWGKFDEEIVSLLSQNKTEEALNKEAQATPLTFMDQKKGEVELVELGTIEARFYKLGPAWLVSLNNGMTVGPSNTFHIYDNVRDKADGKFTRTAAFEETAGPWGQDQLLTMGMQIQLLKAGKKGSEFASFHKPYRAKSNRCQIVWKYDGSSLKPVFWIPEVDWHTVDGQQVAGRGEAYPVGE